MSFEIDTGADITVISKPVYHSLKNRPPLMVNKTVPNSSGGRLPFAGSFIGVILKDGEQYKFNVLVVDSTRKNNLREAEVYPASWVMFLEQMKLVRFQKLVDRRESSAKSVKGELSQECWISHAGKRGKRMTEGGIMMQIETPTDWCAASVSRDPTKSLPSVDDIAPMLIGARYVSTLDANSGLHQVPLDEQSMPLTSFVTPFGRFCYQRLPMAILIGPEIFQLQMQKILRGLSGCDVIMDDILVWGTTLQEYDQCLDEVRKRVWSLD